MFVRLLGLVVQDSILGCVPPLMVVEGTRLIDSIGVKLISIDIPIKLDHI